ncbi:MAG: glycosyltransferase family 4 protein [Anaerolineales bacterium]|nr:glycosyltransferase family 4 protein [Anaerolineales bacterium]
MKRIAILVTQLELAGAQKVAFTQARYFHRHGYETTLCFFYDKYNLLTTVQQQEPFEIVSLEAKVAGKSALTNILYTIRALWRLYWLLRNKRIQILETLTHYSNILGILVGWLAGVPIRISSQRNTLIGFPKWFLWLDATLVNSKLVDLMISVSEETRRFCIENEGMFPEKITTILNGINLTEYENTTEKKNAALQIRSALNIPQNSPVILTVGRLHPQKGHPYLIESAPQILAKFPDSIFVFAGEGDERQSIENHILRLGLPDHFRLLGVREDVPVLLQMADLFVLPSIFEGLPNVVLEAMASHRAVVATKVDGTQEVVVEQDTGLLVPKADPDTLAQAIIFLLQNTAQREQMGLNGYLRVREHFSEELMCQNYEKTILSLLQKKSIHEREPVSNN